MRGVTDYGGFGITMNNELLATLDYLERDRGLDREILKQVIEDSLVSAARRAVGPAHDLRVSLDSHTGEIKALARLKVVEKVRTPESEIDLQKALTQYPDAKLGDELDWEVTPKNFGRIAAQTARQGIMQRLREAQKSRVRDEYVDRIGEVLYGSVSRYERGDVVVDFGQAEGVLRHADRVPREDYQVGDHICCALTDINADRPGPILIVSRSSTALVQGLFEREVAEIAEGIVEIKAVAREAGFRTKIAVSSNDSRVDPVGACVGVRGSRVKTIVRELNGEKVDIVRWDPDIKTYITNSMQPAELRSLEINEANKYVNVIVNPDQLSLAIGKRGQNVRLTNKLTGWHIDINKVEEEKEVGFEEQIQRAVNNLAALPDITPELAEILVHNGFLTVDGINEVDENDLASIDGIDDALAARIKAVAAHPPLEPAESDDEGTE